MCKSIVLAIIPWLCLVFLTSAFSQEEASAVKVKTISGVVVDVDWVTSQFTVRYSDDRPGHGDDELTFTVTSDTMFNKGTEEVEFADVNQGDRVCVEYVDNALRGLRTVRVVLIL